MVRPYGSTSLFSGGVDEIENKARGVDDCDKHDSFPNTGGWTVSDPTLSAADLIHSLNVGPLARSFDQ